MPRRQSPAEFRGYAPGSASGHQPLGQSPNQGHSPSSKKLTLTARQSRASHPAAEPILSVQKWATGRFSGRKNLDEPRDVRKPSTKDRRYEYAGILYL
jgi:hypothetical protein